MKKGKKRKLTKKKKFFIILSCYVALFLITCLTTTITLAWFHSSTWQTGDMYLGGPVYITFGNNSGQTTSGGDKLTTETPPNWSKIYPGMNIRFEASCIMNGASFTQEIAGTDETFTHYATGAVVRARIMLDVTAEKNIEGDDDGSQTLAITEAIYQNIWEQLKYKATEDDTLGGKWIFHQIDSTPENNFFYYTVKGQNQASTGNYELLEVGGSATDVVIDFLKGTVITISPQFDNLYADCKITFTIVFHAMQAYFPYTNADVDTQHLEENRLVTYHDVGKPKPLTINNSIRMFKESFVDHYSNPDAIY